MQFKCGLAYSIARKSREISAAIKGVTNPDLVLERGFNPDLVLLEVSTPLICQRQLYNQLSSFANLTDAAQLAAVSLNNYLIAH